MSNETIQSQAGGGVVAYVVQGNYVGPAYAVTFVKNGGIQTLQYTENGTQLSGYGGLIVSPVSDARSMQFAQLPPAVQQAALALAAGGDITFMNYGIYSAPVFDALIQPPGSSSQHVIVTPSGGLLQSPTGNAPAAVNEAAGANAPEAPVNSDAAQAAATPVGQVTGSLSFQDLSWPVQRAMLDRTSSAHIDTVSTKSLNLPDGGLGYRGMYTRAGQQYQVTVGQNGIVISEGLLNAFDVER